MEDKSRNSELADAIYELGEIQYEILELAQRALGIVQQHLPHSGDLSYRTWFANIQMAMMNESQWIGGCRFTLEDAIKSAEEEIGGSSIWN